MFSVLRGCLSCYKTSPEDNEPNIEDDHTYIELDPEIELAEASMIVHTDEPRTSLHLYNKLLMERAYEELNGSPVNELFNCTTINVNDIDDPLVDRVNCTLTTYNGFSIAREFMDLWKLPCFVICQQRDHSITGMELLAIGSPTAINWISMMIANEQVMRRFFRYSGLMFAQNDCAVTVPQNYPTVFVPLSTPVAKRIPKTQYCQPTPGSAPLKSSTWTTLIPTLSQRMVIQYFGLRHTSTDHTVNIIWIVKMKNQVWHYYIFECLN